MALVSTPPGLPGISGLFAYRPETAAPMRALAQALLRGPSPLEPFEREMIAAYVSSRNGCRFCTRSHAATARKLGAPDLDAASPKMKALFAIAEHVRANVALVPSALVEAAKRVGADDVEIHDATLIAAAFSMFNRYVDGLGADTPEEGDRSYDFGAERLATQGYVPKPA